MMTLYSLEHLARANQARYQEVAAKERLLRAVSGQQPRWWRGLAWSAGSLLAALGQWLMRRAAVPVPTALTGGGLGQGPAIANDAGNR
mgnify:CR=1 FL=1